VLVLSDLAGMLPSAAPKFAKRYANAAGLLESAVRDYADEVRSGQFPRQEHEY
jgi:3-methyl-2-oxobutanoate hydroxymethyltransferase